MMPLKKVRLCLREWQPLPVLPSAQEEVWLWRKMENLRASHARWQLLLLEPGRGSLAEPSGAHLEHCWFRRPCWAQMSQRPPIVLRLPTLWVLSPEEKRFSFFQALAASSKPLPSGSLFLRVGIHMPPWIRHWSCAHKALCYGQSKIDTWIETERRKEDEGSYVDQEALDDRMTLSSLCWIACVGVRFVCAESTPPRVETLPPRLERCSLNEEGTRGSLCTPQNAIGDPGDMFAKGSAATSSWLLHP